MSKFYEPAKDANWRQRNADKIAAHNKAASEARRQPANQQFCCQICGRGFDFGCNCRTD